MFDGKTLSWLHFPSIDSTSLWVKEHAASLPPNAMTIAYADEQTAGRGQYGRTWFSPPKLNLYATFFLRLEKEFPFLANLGQTLAVSCVHVLKSLDFTPEVKWPNDLRLQEKKIGGILTQAVTLDEEWGVLLGLGLNVNMPSDLFEKIDQPATSLLAVSGEEWKIDELLFDIVERFIADLQILREKGFAPLAKQLQEVLCFMGEKVHFSDGKRSFEAICRGIDEMGRLKLEHPSGAIDKVYAGTVKRIS